MSDDKVERIVLWEMKSSGLSCGGFGTPTEFGYFFTRPNKNGRTRRFPAGTRIVVELPAGVPPEYDEPQGGNDE